jgi:hypothetical protein
MTDPPKHGQSGLRLSPRATVALIACLVIYLLVRPQLEQLVGRPLPGLGEPAAPMADDARAPVDMPAADTVPKPTPSERNAGRGEIRPVPATATDVRPEVAAEPEEPALGQLREIRRDVYESTAGLQYRRGSQEGHRLTHLMRHAEDDPDRPVHGVFDGDRDEILAVIDEAYRLIQARGREVVRSERDEGRMVYTVDLGRRIGFVGGQSGARQRHPEARHLRLILDGVDVITAFPVRED